MNQGYRDISLVAMLALISTFLLLPGVTRACTTACTPYINNVGHMIVKSYDWDNRDGLVFLNTGHIKKTAVGVANPKVWTSKYFSVTFNQWGLNMPMGGMNTQGLVVETLKVGDFTKKSTKQDYPDTKEAASGSHAINPLSWVQYILDTSKTLDEAVSQARAVYIDPQFSVPGQEIVGIDPFGIDTVHYNVCNADGNCKTIEYRDKNLIISDIHSWTGLPIKAFVKGKLPFGKDSVGPGGKKVERPRIPVLANNFYDQDSACLEAYASVPKDEECYTHSTCRDLCFDKKEGDVSRYNSKLRFIKAASLSSATSNSSSVQDAVKYGFNEISDGVINDDTRWQIVYLPSLKKVYWRTVDKQNPAHKEKIGHVNISKGQHHHSCRDKENVKVYDLDGSVTGHPYEAIHYGSSKSKTHELTWEEIYKGLKEASKTVGGSVADGAKKAKKNWNDYKKEAKKKRTKYDSLREINDRALYLNFKNSRFDIGEEANLNQSLGMSIIQYQSQSCQ